MYASLATLLHASVEGVLFTVSQTFIFTVAAELLKRYNNKPAPSVSVERH